MYDDDGAFNIDESIGAGRRSPAESGLIQYALGSVVPTSFDFRNGASFTPMKLLARIEQNKPETLTLHVRTNTFGSPFDFEGMAQEPTLATVAGQTGLVLIVDYGDLTGRHRLVADLRSGSFQLPALTFAQVYALMWDPGGVATFGFQAAATFSRAQVSQPKPFTYTAAGELAAAGSALIQIPYYAQYVDIWANGWAGGIGAATAPILRAPEVGLYRDYTTGLFVPPWGPISLSGDSLDTDVFTVENAGAAAVRVFTQFYIEP